MNTDFSNTTTTIRFPFPPFASVSTNIDEVANTPNGKNESLGIFIQDEIFASESLRLIIGARYQNVETLAQATPGLDVSGLDFEDDQVVGSLNALYRLNDRFELVSSVGTAFRAPSLIERLFNGITPEGSGFQLLNPALESETSEYFDFGFKYRDQRAYFDAVLFRNDIDDGIIQDFLSPAEIAMLPAAQQAEVEAARVRFVVQAAQHRPDGDRRCRAFRCVPLRFGYDPRRQCHAARQ